MRLPAEFLNKMENLLGSEYRMFLNSYDEQRYYGLRVNTLKISVEDFLRISPFRLEPIPWTKDGFYYLEGDNPGKHPYYYAGLYYIQEPSAMLPGVVVDAKPGERILDLCAAPGGKSLQIASGLQGQGLLVSNDINSERVKALIKNIELCGVKNALVTNESPDRLAQNLSEYFDKVLVDAPCSGEGMFRKDPLAIRSWENYKCEKCAGMQWEILQNADKLLKPGGVLVYSTCTFSPEENEKMITEFIKQHNNYEIEEIPKMGGMESGRPEWSDGNSEILKTVRLWPHKIKGEGHFVAKLRKRDGSINKALHREQKVARIGRQIENIESNKILDLFRSFIKENLSVNIDGYFNVKGINLYCLPVEYPDLGGIKVAKFGWYLGEALGMKFEPSHSMVVSLKKHEIKNTTDLMSDSSEVLKYLKGETLMLGGEKGYTAVCVDGYTLGWAKQTGDMLKNLYPKGWRKMS